MMKSWTHPGSESVSSYVGALANSGILLLTVDRWTTEVAAFPLFIRLCLLRPGPPGRGPGGAAAARCPAFAGVPRHPSPRHDVSPARRGQAGPDRKFARDVTTTKEACVPTAHGNGIDIEYQTSGDPADPPLLLVMGLGAQLIAWPEAFVAAADRTRLLHHPLRQSGLRPLDEVRGHPGFLRALRW